MTRASEKLERFGFSFERGGAHIARTMMLAELTELLAHVASPETEKAQYLEAVDEENCLGKRSVRTRRLTFKHLASLYALDPSVTLFRALRYLWDRDPAGRPRLALLCAYARDAVLRATARFVQGVPRGEVLTREELEEFIDAQAPGRFSKATLKSTAQNVNSTWTQSGHLTGRVKKMRSQASASAGSVAYALLLGYLQGVRGSALFTTEYVKLLDCSGERARELAEEASRRGWIVMKQIGSVVEVVFPAMLTALEMEWIHEQD